MHRRWTRSWLTLFLGVLLAGPAAAQSGGGMNSNKPQANDKLMSKEPAYGSMNSNKPTSGMNSGAPAPRQGGLTGVNPNDLKVKPSDKSMRKEPAK